MATEQVPVTVIHVHEVRLPKTSQLGKHKHARTRGIDASLLVKKLTRRPGIVDPDCWVPTNPESDDWGLVLLGDLLKVYPWFVIGKEVCISYQG